MKTSRSYAKGAACAEGAWEVPRYASESLRELLTFTTQPAFQLNLNFQDWDSKCAAGLRTVDQGGGMAGLQGVQEGGMEKAGSGDS